MQQIQSFRSGMKFLIVLFGGRLSCSGREGGATGSPALSQKDGKRFAAFLVHS